MRSIKLSRNRRGGFTLAELMVAMAITMLLLTLLVSVTGVALDGWRVSRNKVRAARQAKAALDQVGRDFESMVVRSGNNFEWLFTESNKGEAPGPGENKSPNAARMIFFTAATDRYDGRVGDAEADLGGDVSAAGYRLVYKDPITGVEDERYNVFVLYRQLVNPKEGEEKGTFYELLAEEDLEQAFEEYDDDLDESENFVCENIFEMSIVFTIEYNQTDAEGRTVTKIERVPVLATKSGNSVNEFRLRGNGIVVDGQEDADYANGRIVSVDVSISVLTDNGVATLRRNDFGGSDERREDFLARNTYRFSKTVLLPQP